MTRQQKIDAAIEHLTTRHLDTEGGYPFDYRWFDNDLVIASIQYDGASRIDVYTKAQLLAIYAEEMAS